MAEPISNIKRIQLSEEEVKRKNLNEVLEAVSANKESVIKALNLATPLDDNGMLDFLNALIKQKEEGLNNIFTELNKDKYANALENASELLFLLGDINLDHAREFTGKVNAGMQEALMTDTEEKTSYTGMLKALKEPEINRSITMLLMFLRGMGRN